MQAPVQEKQSLEDRPDDPVLLALRDSAALIAKQATALKLQDQASRAPNLTPNQVAQIAKNQNLVPKGLEQKISIPRYEGPFENLVIAIAKAVNWEFEFANDRPATDQIIVKSYQNMRAVDALRDIGNSVNGALISIDTSDITKRKIRIYYQ